MCCFCAQLMDLYLFINLFLKIRHVIFFPFPNMWINLIKRWVIEVHGAPGTLYANETFQLQVDFPEHYPMEAPQVDFFAVWIWAPLLQLLNYISWYRWYFCIQHLCTLIFIATVIFAWVRLNSLPSLLFMTSCVFLDIWWLSWGELSLWNLLAGHFYAS